MHVTLLNMSAVFTVLTRPWSWLRRSAPKTDYEEVLATLSADIDHVQTNLVQIQTRKRRATIILPLWASLFWAIYTTVMYFTGWLTDSDDSGNLLVVWGPVLVAPLLIFFTRRIVRWWYKRVQAAEEEHLKELKRQRGAKIEEIKRATKYDHLKMLLDKYDEQGGQRGAVPGNKSAPGTPAGKGMAGPQTPNRGTPQQAPGSQQRPIPGGTASMAATPLQQQQQGVGAARAAVPGATAPTIVRPPLPSAMSAPVQRTWLDRVADAVLGSDPTASALGPEQKYALICTKCKNHNGLATREEFDEVRESSGRAREKTTTASRSQVAHLSFSFFFAEYICPHCGTFNTRRPSSVPVSSPWRSSTNAKSAASTPIPSRLSQTTHAPSSSSLRPSSRLMDDTDSPPPASPLGRRDEDEDDDSSEVEYEMSSSSANTGASPRTDSVLNQRRSTAATAASSDGDVDMQQ